MDQGASNNVTADTNQVKTNTPTATSPWEEELDLPEEKPNKPNIIGSLHEGEKPKEPVSFVMPEKVEESVGAKIPAEEIIKKENIPEPHTELPKPIDWFSSEAQSSTVGDSLHDKAIKKEPVAVSVPPQVSQEIIPNITKNNQASASTEAGLISSPTQAPQTAPNNLDFPKKPIAKIVPSEELESNAAKTIPLNQVTQENNQSQIQSVQSQENTTKNILSKLFSQKKKEINSVSHSSIINPSKVKSYAYIFSIIGLLFISVILTESGYLSIGLEKVYGSAHIEALWNGLSINTDKALLQTAAEMKTHPEFTANGKINLTIDSSIKSDFTKPLLSFANSIKLADERMTLPVKARKTLSESESEVDDYYFTDFVDDSSTDEDESSDDSIVSDSSTSISNLSTDNTTASSDDSISSETTESTTIESQIRNVELDVDFKNSLSGSEVELKNGTSQTLKLINQKEKLYFLNNNASLTTSTDINAGKYVEYSLPQLESKDIQRDFFNVKADSGLSLKGKRVANEKVDGIRCFKYEMNNLEIGNAFSDFGITSDMLQSASGNIWIGISDKKIRKINLKIITPISSAITTINVELTFSKYDQKNTITDVTEAEIVRGTAAVASTQTQSETNDIRRKTDVQNILTALTNYKTANGSYPVANSILKLNSSSNIIESALVPRYLASMPVDPKSVDGWYYDYKSDGKTCSVAARLENVSDAEGTKKGNVTLYIKVNNN